jgi:hypothetical protein
LDGKKRHAGELVVRNKAANLEQEHASLASAFRDTAQYISLGYMEMGGRRPRKHEIFDAL